MLVVGLTGGIGAGKSTVSSLLAGRGAVIVDTDVVARSVVAPGGSAHDAMVARFGAALAADRRALAGVVFSDPAALADLNAIVHPAVRDDVARRLASLDAATQVVVLDVPLLVESGGRDHYGVAGVLVVDCPEEVAVARLVDQRGMDEADARRRMAAQASRAERLAAADFVIHNEAGLDQLAAEVDAAWEWIQRL
ncbi:MAG: dephospho-CoA kinase [Actinomycetota bacterium]|jgi:dephospho-CoA kinase|nr:dephospho-CoA kinase [Actinomycetota bacterium]